MRAASSPPWLVRAGHAWFPASRPCSRPERRCPRSPSRPAPLVFRRTRPPEAQPTAGLLVGRTSFVGVPSWKFLRAFPETAEQRRPVATRSGTCWTYGSSPRKRARIALALISASAPNCSDGGHSPAQLAHHDQESRCLRWPRRERSVKPSTPQIPPAGAGQRRSPEGGHRTRPRLAPMIETLHGMIGRLVTFPRQSVPRVLYLFIFWRSSGSNSGSFTTGHAYR